MVARHNPVPNVTGKRSKTMAGSIPLILLGRHNPVPNVTGKRSKTMEGSITLILLGRHNPVPKVTGIRSKTMERKYQVSYSDTFMNTLFILKYLRGSYV